MIYDDEYGFPLDNLGVKLDRVMYVSPAIVSQSPQERLQSAALHRSHQAIPGRRECQEFDAHTHAVSSWQLKQPPARLVQSAARQTTAWHCRMPAPESSSDAAKSTTSPLCFPRCSGLLINNGSSLRPSRWRTNAFMTKLHSICVATLRTPCSNCYRTDNILWRPRRAQCTA